MKKGQITPFIILGIVILVVIAFTFAFSGRIKEFFKDETDVNSFAQGCFSQAQACMLQRLGENGGSFSFYSGLATLQNTKGELESNIEKGAVICQNNFNEFGSMKIEAQLPKVGVSFNKKDTTAQIQQRIILTKGDKTTTLENFVIKSDVRYSDGLNYAQRFFEPVSNIVDSKYIDTELLENNEFDTHIYEGSDEQIIIITDELSRIKGTEKFKFSFIR